MKRRHKTYRPRPVRVPTLIALEVSPSVETSEEMALVSLREGWADIGQFNILAECCDMLSTGAAIKDDEDARKVAELGTTALLNIRDRYHERKRVGATGDELGALRIMVDFSRDWWKRQGGETFRAAYVAVDVERAKMEGIAA